MKDLARNSLGTQPKPRRELTRSDGSRKPRPVNPASRALDDARIGTAGWTLPKQHATSFRAAAEGEKLSHLERYSHALNCVEINSSFHRPHQRKTWERWAASTPDSFRFAVKAPKAITHTAKLLNCGALLQEFLEQASGLGVKLGPLLVQLPPSLAFDPGAAHEFFTTLRELHPSGERLAPVALEPRHASWFTPPVNRLLRDFEVARVAADPPKGSALAAQPGGWSGLRYFRLHGAPRTYYSEYDDAHLATFAHTLRTPSANQEPAPETWVIFDNTALGHATANALSLKALLAPPDRARRLRL